MNCYGSICKLCSFNVGLTPIQLIFELIIRIVGLVAAVVLVVVSVPVIREVPIADWHYYSYPNQEIERVPMTLDIILCIIVPVVTIAILYLSIFIWNDAFKTSFPFAWYFTEALNWFWSYSLCIILNSLSVEFVKSSVGALRPDYLHRCFPTGFNLELINSTVPVCEPQVDQHLLDEGRRSFYSGHSTFTMTCFVHTALYAHSLIRSSGLNVFGGFGTGLVGFFLLPGFFVCITRFQEYRHWPGDIITGMIAGTFYAIICFKTYFPWIRNLKQESDLLLKEDEQLISGP